MMRRLILLILLTGILIISTQAQDGRGLIRIGVLNDLDTQFTSFNPMMCNDSACNQITELLFPSLFAVDPETRWLTPATEENNALADSWTMNDDNRTYNITLKPDAVWSDGTPITAYDYFYGFLLAKSDYAPNNYIRSYVDQYIEGVVPFSDHDMAIIFKGPVCDWVPYADIPFIPAHVFDENFATTTATFFEDRSTELAMWSAWEESNEYDFSFMQDHPFNAEPSVTGGTFQFVDWDHRDHIRLQNGDVALEFVPASSENEIIDRFLSGDLNMIYKLPPERIADFADNPDVQVIESHIPLWTYLVFNLADPTEPMSAFDEDGNPLEQGEHPILSNVNIRRAIQLGIDVDSLIDIAHHGQGTTIPDFSPPISWGFNETTQHEYNPDEADRLLEEAGWVHVANRSYRECVNCAVVADGTRLSLSLGHLQGRYYPVTAIAIQQQLRRIGIDISTYPTTIPEIFSQRFDLFLGIWGDTFPTPPLAGEMLVPEEDVLGSGWNMGSYHNPEFSEKINLARTISRCALPDRQNLFDEAQAIIEQDLPYIPLYAETWTTVIRADVQNVSMFPLEQFGNIDDWVVFNAD